MNRKVSITEHGIALVIVNLRCVLLPEHLIHVRFICIPETSGLFTCRQKIFYGQSLTKFPRGRYSFYLNIVIELSKWRLFSCIMLKIKNIFFLFHIHVANWTKHFRYQEFILIMSISRVDLSILFIQLKKQRDSCGLLFPSWI